MHILFNINFDLEKGSRLGNFLCFIIVVASNSNLKKQLLINFLSIFWS